MGEPNGNESHPRIEPAELDFTSVTDPTESPATGERARFKASLLESLANSYNERYEYEDLSTPIYDGEMKTRGGDHEVLITLHRDMFNTEYAWSDICGLDSRKCVTYEYAFQGDFWSNRNTGQNRAAIVAAVNILGTTFEEFKNRARSEIAHTEAHSFMGGDWPEANIRATKELMGMVRNIIDKWWHEKLLCPKTITGASEVYA